MTSCTQTAASKLPLKHCQAQYPSTFVQIWYPCSTEKRPNGLDIFERSSSYTFHSPAALFGWSVAPHLIDRATYNTISIWNNGPRAGSQPIKCIYNSDIFIFSQPRLTACCEKKVCARCANWKTEQQLIVMSSGKNSRMNKMQDIPTWPESREAQTFPVYFWIVLFIGRLFTEFFARLMSHL